MKLKYYLRGIGIGVVVTTVIFMILISIHKNDTDPGRAPAADTESKTVAELKNDMQEETEDASSKQPESLGDNTKDSPAPLKNPDAKAKDDTEENGRLEEESPSKTKPGADRQEKVRFEISGGEYSDVICRKLAEADLIDDAAAFNKFLVEKDYDNAILPGVYDIPRDSTYEEIAALLTAKVDSRKISGE